MKKKCSAVVAINLLLLDDEIDCEQLLEMLQTDVLKYNIIEDCLPAYIQALLKVGIHGPELFHPHRTSGRLILGNRLTQNAEWLRTVAGYPKSFQAIIQLFISTLIISLVIGYRRKTITIHKYF